MVFCTRFRVRTGHSTAALKTDIFFWIQYIESKSMPKYFECHQVLAGPLWQVRQPICSKKRMQKKLWKYHISPLNNPQVSCFQCKQIITNYPSGLSQWNLTRNCNAQQKQATLWMSQQDAYNMLLKALKFCYPALELPRTTISSSLNQKKDAHWLWAIMMMMGDNC
jgi:hypothetical protein